MVEFNGTVLEEYENLDYCLLSSGLYFQPVINLILLIPGSILVLRQDRNSDRE